MTWWATFSPWALSLKRAIIEEEQQCGAVHEGICGLLSAGPSAGQTSITWLSCKVCSQAFLSRKILFHLAVCFTAYFKSGIIPGMASPGTSRTLGMSVTHWTGRLYNDSRCPVTAVQAGSGKRLLCSYPGYFGLISYSRNT